MYNDYQAQSNDCTCTYLLLRGNRDVGYKRFWLVSIHRLILIFTTTLNLQWRYRITSRYIILQDLGVDTRAAIVNALHS